MRLTTDLWVSAYLTRLRLADIPVYVTARGDATAGAVIVKCATLDGQAHAVQRSYDLMTGTRVWVTLAEGPEADVDATLRRRAAEPRPHERPGECGHHTGEGGRPERGAKGHEVKGKDRRLQCRHAGRTWAIAWRAGTG